MTDALSAAKKFSTAKTRHRSLTLAGGSGVGKTHLAFAIAWAWLEVPWGTVRYWQAERLLDELRRGYSREEGREDTYALLDQAMGCSLLILDDLGAHKQGDWATAKLDEIVDTRYAHARHMVVTTNDPAKLPERIQDRLLEGVTIGIPASVSSWRRSPDVRGKLEAR